MNFFKRAILSVTRRKGKSAILFAVIFILGNVMAGAISIEQGTTGVENTIKKQLGATASISYDYSKMDDQSDSDVLKEPKTPTPETYTEIGNLNEVNYFDFSLNDFAMTKNLKNIEPKDGSYQIGNEGEHYFSLKGVNYPDIIDVKNKQISIKDGRVFTDEEVSKGKAVAVISDELAKENNLRVGDKMVMDRIIQDYSNMDSSESDTNEQTEIVKKDYPVEIIGTFKVEQAEQKRENKKKDTGMDQVNLYDKMNTIYVSNNYMKTMRTELFEIEYDKFPGNFDMGEEKKPSKEELLKDLDTSQGMTATYVLKKPELVEDFRIKANKILEQHKITDFKVIVSSDQYDSVAGPVKGMAKIANLVLIISIFASVLIITLVVVLFLRDRKHELGIYLSLGESRLKVIGQIVIEVLVVAVLAITISVFSGNVLAKSFSNTLMQTQKTEESADDMMNFNPGDWELSQLTNNEVSEDDVIDAYSIKLTPSYIVLFYVIGLGVILISTVAPLVYIMRLNPKKIMM